MPFSLRSPPSVAIYFDVRGDFQSSFNSYSIFDIIAFSSGFRFHSMRLESALSKSRITCRPHRNFCHSIHLHPFHHIHVGVVDLVFGLHIDFDFGTVHRRESRSEAQVVSIDANTYAIQ